MNVVVFGATGMVGSGVVLECLDDSRVTSVLVVGRSPCGISHAKLREVLSDDLLDPSGIGTELAGKDACFFCVGVSSAGKSEEVYHRLTYELTMVMADAFVRASPDATFCYVSGAGTDSTEKGRFMWARVKGKTENHLLRLPLKAVYLFRPGYIQPMRGVRSRTRLYQAAYALVGPLYPVLRRLFPKQVTTTESVGRAMIQAAAGGHATPVLETTDINTLARAAGS